MSPRLRHLSKRGRRAESISVLVNYIDDGLFKVNFQAKMSNMESGTSKVSGFWTVGWSKEVILKASLWLLGNWNKHFFLHFKGQTIN